MVIRWARVRNRPECPGKAAAGSITAALRVKNMAIDAASTVALLSHHPDNIAMMAIKPNCASICNELPLSIMIRAIKFTVRAALEAKRVLVDSGSFFKRKVAYAVPIIAAIKGKADVFSSDQESGMKAVITGDIK